MIHSFVNKVKSLFGIEEEKKRRKDDEEDYYPAPKKRQVDRYFEKYRYKPGVSRDNYNGIERSDTRLPSSEENSEISFDPRDEEDDDDQYQNCYGPESFENGTPHQEQNFGRWTEMNSVRKGYDVTENQMNVGHSNQFHQFHKGDHQDLNSRNDTTFRRSSRVDMERNNEHARYLHDVISSKTSNQLGSPQRMEDAYARHTLTPHTNRSPFTRDMLVSQRIDCPYTRDTFASQRMDGAITRDTSGYQRRQLLPVHGFSGKNLSIINFRRGGIRADRPMSQQQICSFGKGFPLKKSQPASPPLLKESRYGNKNQHLRIEPMREHPIIDAKDDGFKAYRQMLQHLTKNRDEFSELVFSGNEPQEFKMFEPQLKRNKSFFNVPVKNNLKERQNRKIDIIDLSRTDESDDELRYIDSYMKSPNSTNILSTPESEKLKEASSSLSLLEKHEGLIPKTKAGLTTTVTSTSLHPQNGTDTEFFENFIKKCNTDKGKTISEEDLETLTRLVLVEKHKHDSGSFKENGETTADLDASVLEKKDGLPQLTPVMLSFVEAAIKDGYSNALAFCNAKDIAPGDIRSLAGKNWVNDKVINAYMDILVQRGELEGYPSVFAFSTFFYMKLREKGYSAVVRWTKTIDIFEQDILLVPLHLGIHWALCVIDCRQKSICYYDSMSGNNYRVLETMLNYLKEEKENKKNEHFEESEWVTKLMKDIPQQRNGYDCGVFTCVYAEFLSRGAVKDTSLDNNIDSKCICSYPPFPFSSDDMGYFRKKIIYEILIGRILE